MTTAIVLVRSHTCTHWILGRCTPQVLSMNQLVGMKTPAEVTVATGLHSVGHAWNLSIF